PWRWDDIISDLGMRQADAAHASGVMVVRTVADIDEAHRSGRVGLVFGLEAATPIENEIDRLDVLYGLGLRQIGIAYSDANALGSGLAEATDGGLTALGRRAVRRMNQLGLAIDVSHSSDRTALDVCEQSDQPVLMTHAGARAAWITGRSGRTRCTAITSGCTRSSPACSAWRAPSAGRISSRSRTSTGWRIRPRTSPTSAAGSSSTALTTTRSAPSSAGTSTGRCSPSGWAEGHGGPPLSHRRGVPPPARAGARPPRPAGR